MIEEEVDEAMPELQATHPTSDVGALLRLRLETLRHTVYVARDIYHEGLSVTQTRGREPTRLEMVREVLTLRAAYYAKPRAARQALKVGHASETQPKPVLVFSEPVLG